MTKMDITVILNLGNVCSDSKEHKNIRERAGEAEEAFQQCDFFESPTMGMQMEELNVNLKVATDYLISLFEATDQKYSCSRIKLGKLLSIVAFKYACSNQLVFKEDVYKYKDCGAIMYGMNAITDMSPYIRFDYLDNKEYIDTDFIGKVPVQNDLPVDVKRKIESVFRYFGSYPAKDIGCMINPILALDNILDEDGKVNLCLFKDIKPSAIKNANDSSNLVSFLFDA